jgi:hypothetical protein
MGQGDEPKYIQNMKIDERRRSLPKSLNVMVGVSERGTHPARRSAGGEGGWRREQASAVSETAKRAALVAQPLPARVEFDKSERVA